MKKNKTFDAVQVMRDIRDRMSREIKGMAPEKQIDYIEKRSGLSGKPDEKAAAVSEDA